jgi:hypothetical protein
MLMRIFDRCGGFDRYWNWVKPVPCIVCIIVAIAINGIPNGLHKGNSRLTWRGPRERKLDTAIAERLWR